VTPRGNVDARRAAGLLALAAALAWSLKLGLIVSNGGENLDEGLVAVAYMLGLALFVATGAALGLALTTGRAAWLRGFGALLGPIAVLVLVGVLSSVGEPLVGDAGPSWLPDEVEIGLMVLVGLVAAGLLLRRRPEPARRGVPVR